jgi:hypothetical protein
MPQSIGNTPNRLNESPAAEKTYQSLKGLGIEDI